MENEKANCFRFIYLMVEVVPEILRFRLKQSYRNSNLKTLPSFLKETNVLHTLFHLFYDSSSYCCWNGCTMQRERPKGFSKEQWNILYDADSTKYCQKNPKYPNKICICCVIPKNIDEKVLDLSLLCLLLNNCSNLMPNEKEAVQNIRELKNDHVSHKSSCRLSESDFLILWKKAELYIKHLDNTNIYLHQRENLLKGPIDESLMQQYFVQSLETMSEIKMVHASIDKGNEDIKNIKETVDKMNSYLINMQQQEPRNAVDKRKRHEPTKCSDVPNAQDSVSNMGGASLNTISTDDEDGDIWKMSDAVLEDEALDNPALYDEFYSDLESGGATTTEASIEEILNRWETEEVQFGIVGRSGMGKSTFINLLLNLSPTDPGHAKVGEGDSTTLIKIYGHPKFGSFKLVDFPGFGTLNMTKDQFLVKFNSVNLDYFFVFIDTVLMEEDKWLVKKLKERKIAYSFVRSKIDVNVDKARKNGTNEQEAIAQIRSRLEDTMARNDTLRGSKLFLISNFKEYFHYGDLIRLLIHITSLIPDGKVEALLFFLPLLTPELIELKCKTLKKRIKFVAVATGVIAAIPIPLVDFPVNMAIVTREVRRYIRILNLDQPYVKKVPGLKHPSLKEKTKIESIKAQFMKCLKLGAVAAVSQLDCVLPGIGSAIAGPAAIALIAHHLKSELEVLRVDAEVVYVYMLERT